MTYETQTKEGNELNRLYEEDLPIHEWYRFVLSFPPHLVRDYIKKFNLTKNNWVLDPFCGTGTTIVECKKNGIPSVGLEANPVVQYLANAKTQWEINPEQLIVHAKKVADLALEILDQDGINDEPYTPLFGNEIDKSEMRCLDPEREKLLIKNSISSRPLHKVLVLIEAINKFYDEEFFDLERTALAKQLVYSISNLRFGPEVGVGKKKTDSFVIQPWLNAILGMADDLKKENVVNHRDIPGFVVLSDSRNIHPSLEPMTFDAVFTSPPYPNEKDYSRTTRLESVLLGFMKTKKDLRQHKDTFIRSNTRGVYKKDDDSLWVKENDRIQDLADRIEKKRNELGKTSGFEKLYPFVVRHYFGGMAKHLHELRRILTPGAQLGYVVGDQASYFRILIRTGKILAEVAEDIGYEVQGIDLFRTRFSTATKEELREEVVLLRWPG